MKPPELRQARRVACGGWAASAIGWSELSAQLAGENRAWAVAVAGVSAAIALMYALWLLLVGGRS